MTPGRRGPGLRASRPGRSHSVRPASSMSLLRRLAKLLHTWDRWGSRLRLAHLSPTPAIGSLCSTRLTACGQHKPAWLRTICSSHWLRPGKSASEPCKTFFASVARSRESIWFMVASIRSQILSDGDAAAPGLAEGAVGRQPGAPPAGCRRCLIRKTQDRSPKEDLHW